MYNICIVNFNGNGDFGSHGNRTGEELRIHRGRGNVVDPHVCGADAQCRALPGRRNCPYVICVDCELHQQHQLLASAFVSAAFNRVPTAHNSRPPMMIRSLA